MEILKFLLAVTLVVKVGSKSSPVFHFNPNTNFELFKTDSAATSIIQNKYWSKYLKNPKPEQNYNYGWKDHGSGSVSHLNKGEFDVAVFIKFINQFLGVMGPFLFPLPYVLAMIPFAIPAIPLAIWFDMRNGESHHPTKDNHTTTTTERIEQYTTLPTTVGTTPTTITSSTTQQQPQPTTNPISPTRPTPPPTPITDFPPTFEMISTNHSTTTNTTNGNPSNPMNNMTIDGPSSIIDFPSPNPLFPFPLFLNSSYLGPDYNNDEFW